MRGEVGRWRAFFCMKMIAASKDFLCFSTAPFLFVGFEFMRLHDSYENRIMAKVSKVSKALHSLVGLQVNYRKDERHGQYVQYVRNVKPSPF